MKKKILLVSGIVMMLLASMLVSADICLDKTAPSAPTNLKVSSSPYDADGDVVLSWSAATDEPECSGIDHYNVYRSLDNQVFVKIAEATDLTYDDNGLTQGKKYYYYVAAVDKVQFNPHVGPKSNTVSTTIGTAPSNDDGNEGSGGGSSSGGGGGGGSYDDSKEWNCGDWSECIDGRQSQTCEHKTRTGVTKKNTQDCTEGSETTSLGICEEDWECTDWSDCIDGKRTCPQWIDKNECGTEYDKPADNVEASCFVINGDGSSAKTLSGGRNSEGDDGSSGDGATGAGKTGEVPGITGAVIGGLGSAGWIYLIILLLIIAGLLIWFFAKKKKKGKKGKKGKKRK